MNTTNYILIGIGIAEEYTGQRKIICPTWPDCPVRSAGEDTTDTNSPYAAKGYVSQKGAGTFTAVGGRVFDTEYEALGWLEFSSEGQTFKKSFQNVLVVPMEK